MTPSTPGLPTRPGAEHRHRTLVIGAGRVLRPTAIALAERGTGVLAVVRTPASASVLRPALRSAGRDGMTRTEALDARDPAALGRLLDTACSTALDAIAYAPALSSPSLDLLVSRCAATTIVHTSAVATPRTDPEDAFDLTRFASRRPGAVHLVLGWADGPRWHSPEEIAVAALRAHDSRVSGVLGRLRPWARRPL